MKVGSLVKASHSEVYAQRWLAGKTPEFVLNRRGLVVQESSVNEASYRVQWFDGGESWHSSWSHELEEVT